MFKFLNAVCSMCSACFCLQPRLRFPQLCKRTAIIWNSCMEKTFFFLEMLHNCKTLRSLRGNLSRSASLVCKEVYVIVCQPDLSLSQTARLLRAGTRFFAETSDHFLAGHRGAVKEMPHVLCLVSLIQFACTDHRCANWNMRSKQRINLWSHRCERICREISKVKEM